MNADAIIKRKIQIAKEIMEELKTSKSPRVEILLATTYTEFILKDFMEFLLKTEEARRIPRELIVDILEVSQLITKELAHDVKQIFHIRDAYAYRPSLFEANEYVEKEVLPKLNCVKNESPKVQDWEKRPLTQKIYDSAEWIFVNLDNQFYKIAEPS